MWSSAHAKMSKNLDANVTQKPEAGTIAPTLLQSISCFKYMFSKAIRVNETRIAPTEVILPVFT